MLFVCMNVSAVSQVEKLHTSLPNANKGGGPGMVLHKGSGIIPEQLVGETLFTKQTGENLE